MADLCLPLSAGEDAFELHSVQLELEAVEKQINELLERQAQLRERQTALETSRADAHRSGVSIQCAANTPTTSTPCVSLHRPVHPGRDLLRCPSLRRRDTTDPGCGSSGRRERGLGLHHLPLRRFRSSRSPPETASPPSTRRNVTLWSSETPSSGTSVLR